MPATQPLRLCLALALAMATQGCAGGGAYRSAGAYSESYAGAPDPGYGADSDTRDGLASDAEAPTRMSGSAAPRYAQLEGAEADEGVPGTSSASSASSASAGAATATDAIPSTTPLLIYTATLTLAVHRVEDQQNALVQIAREQGGFLAQRTGTQIVLRIPAARFQDALAATELLGDVLSRHVQAQDVTEEFRDTTLRLRNLEVMRARLERLLENATDVNDALAVEREMQRVTSEIERLRGRIRFLSDRLAYSTITVDFRPRPTTQEHVDEFQLPFPWLNQLGLPRLLEVR